MHPSRLIAAFRITNGRALAHQREERLVQARAAAAGPTPDLDVDAVLAQVREAPAAHQRIRDPRRAATTRDDAGLDDAVDARPGAPDVTARLERAVERAAARAPRPPSSSARTSACGSPARSWYPCPTTTPSVDTTTAPTIGFGLVRPRPRAAWNSARAM